MYLISQLAKAAGVNIETVRYYQRYGLIIQPPKPIAGYRCYPQMTLNRILFIKRAQELGFSLKEINQLLMLNDTPCQEAQDIASKKQASVCAKIADLQRLKNTLDDVLSQCATNLDHNHCPLIDSLLPQK